MGIQGPPAIRVIGAGVIGLSTAIRLREAGHPVSITADQKPEHTTSSIAGATWSPYLAKTTEERQWAIDTRKELHRIAESAPTNGVRILDGLETSDGSVKPPTWAVPIDELTLCRPPAAMASYSTAWRYRIPIVDMPRYLSYLSARLARTGTGIRQRRAHSLREEAALGSIVVNCTGLGAADLVPDPTVHPLRGQIVIVDNVGIDQFFADNLRDQDETSILPHRDHIVLGGASTPDRTDTAPDLRAATQIMRRCIAIEPRLSSASVLGHRVGLRPMRHRARVEHVRLNGIDIIHNYGHGPIGLTLSWGCADRVLEIVELLRDNDPGHPSIDRLRSRSCPPLRVSI